MDILSHFLRPALTTCVIYFAHRWYSKQERFGFYAVIYLVFFALSFFSFSQLSATEEVHFTDSQIEQFNEKFAEIEKTIDVLTVQCPVKLFYNKKMMTNEEKASCVNLITYHMQKGRDSYNLAHKYSLMTPNYTAVQLCDEIYKGSLAAIIASLGNPARLAVALVSEALFSYGMNVYSNWKSVCALLDHAEWHFGQAAEYQRQLKYG